MLAAYELSASTVTYVKATGDVPAAIAMLHIDSNASFSGLASTNTCHSPRAHDRRLEARLCHPSLLAAYQEVHHMYNPACDTGPPCRAKSAHINDTIQCSKIALYRAFAISRELRHLIFRRDTGAT